MKLINADELVKAIENENPGLSISGTVEKFARTIQVKMQPTVEAIPIEWIEKYIKQNYCTCDVVYPEEFLKELVTWWKEENEQNKENTSQND